MKLVRNAIEPPLLAAGFAFDARNQPHDPAEQVWIGYAKLGSLFSVGFKPSTGCLTAELLEGGVLRTVA